MNTRKLKKVGAAVIAIICAALIFITGTYAFQIMTQQGWGRAVSRDQLPAGRLHVDQEVIGDNFGELNWYPGQRANNEVYVENFGDITPIFTRVRLFEYMESGIGAQLHPKDADFAGRDVQPLIEGANRVDPTTWAVVLPHSEDDSEPSAFRNYWTLTQDGGSKHFMPTFNQDPVSREPDVKGDAWGLVPMSPEQPNSTRRGLPHAVEDERDYLTDQAYAYPPEAGLSDYFEQNPDYEATVKSYDWDLDIHIMDTAPVPHTARETLDAKIMTMEQWHDAGKPVGEIWVLDTDGWAYWAEALEPGDATGLLLNEMTYISPAMGTVYYAIYADAQMATLGSWALAFEDLTDEAKDLMNTIANPAYEIILSENGTVSFPDGLASNTESADRVITVTNAGNYPTGALSIELGGANPDSFELSTTELPNLAVGESTTFAVHSKEGLAIGTHTAKVTVGGEASITAQSFNMSIVVKEGIALMREGLGSVTVVPTQDNLFLTFPIQRQEVERFEVINQNITNLNTFAAGSFGGQNVLAAVDVTHADSDYPVVAFYTEGNTTGRYNVYIAGRGGVVATGSMELFFAQLINATNIDITLLNTSRVTNMHGLFGHTKALTALDVSKLDVSNARSIRSMFYEAERLTTLNLSGFDTSNVIDMSHLFGGASSLTTLDLSRWNTSNVTDMRGMFYGASSLTTLNLSEFDTSNVIDMGAMFYGASSLTSLDLSGFNTSHVTNMAYMFYKASSLTTLNMSGWNTSNVTDMSGMFQVASSLTKLDLSGFDTSSVMDMSTMFYGASSLTALDLSGFDTSSVTEMSLMFYGTNSLTTVGNISGWNTSNVTNMNHMFAFASSLTTLNLSGWDTSRVVNMLATFAETSLETLDLSGWNTSSVANMGQMFQGTRSLTTVDFRKATFGSVTINGNMFLGSGIETIIVGSTAAQTYIQNAPGWADVAGRTITVAP